MKTMNVSKKVYTLGLLAGLFTLSGCGDDTVQTTTAAVTTTATCAEGYTIRNNVCVTLDDAFKVDCSISGGLVTAVSGTTVCRRETVLNSNQAITLTSGWNATRTMNKDYGMPRISLSKPTGAVTSTDTGYTYSYTTGYNTGISVAAGTRLTFSFYPGYSYWGPIDTSNQSTSSWWIFSYTTGTQTGSCYTYSAETNMASSGVTYDGLPPQLLVSDGVEAQVVLPYTSVKINNAGTIWLGVNGDPEGQVCGSISIAQVKTVSCADRLGVAVDCQ